MYVYPIDNNLSLFTSMIIYDSNADPAPARRARALMFFLGGGGLYL